MPARSGLISPSAENAQDEATITVIATGLDEHSGEQHIEKAMTGFANYKAKIPTPAPQPQAAPHGNQEAAATAGNAFRSNQNFGRSSYTAPQSGSGSYGQASQQQSPRYGNYGGQNYNSAPSGQNSERPSGPAFRPTANKDLSINIPDFLKNRK